MKSIEKMINEIDIESLEKTINMLSGLKTFKKYNCETCRHEISSICLDCNIKNKSKGWEPKEEKIDCQTCRFTIHECGVCCYEKKEEKPVEKQVFELIKNKGNFEEIWGNKNLSFKSFEQMILLGYEPLRLHFFLTIMKGVHELIEDENKLDYTKSIYYLIHESNKFLINEDDKYLINVVSIQKTGRYKYFPDCFYFSKAKNALQAKEILSNFFGINILDWWYK